MEWERMEWERNEEFQQYVGKCKNYCKVIPVGLSFCSDETGLSLEDRICKPSTCAYFWYLALF